MFSWMLQNSPKTFKTSNIFWSVRQVLAFPVEIHEFSCNSQNDWSELYMCSRNFSKYLELSESLWNTMIIFFLFVCFLMFFKVLILFWTFADHSNMFRICWKLWKLIASDIDFSTFLGSYQSFSVAYIFCPEI